ncbi:hypothetical protein DL93DRAFT_2086632 [Clavulina sp. PMI_390]|nr:hypothetical protein DL93DRAFT_2089245 [Clavulina sp. PMI_390]KAF8308597.1 hypothetical protein DL93DRAFT_2086632 [Clavulina sp. PMI_390]
MSPPSRVTIGAFGETYSLLLLAVWPSYTHHILTVPLCSALGRHIWRTKLIEGPDASTFTSSIQQAIESWLIAERDQKCATFHCPESRPLTSYSLPTYAYCIQSIWRIILTL